MRIKVFSPLESRLGLARYPPPLFLDGSPNIMVQQQRNDRMSFGHDIQRSYLHVIHHSKDKEAVDDGLFVCLKTEKREYR